MKKQPIYLSACTISMLAWGFLGALLGSSQTVTGGEWPQILGPSRSGVAENEKLTTSWPVGGPKKLWSKSIGMGYASAAIQGDQVIVFHRVGSDERLESLTLDGKTRWIRNFPAYYRGGVNNDLGPRCTPVIDGAQFFAYGAAGDLYCVSLADGKVRWNRSLARDYSAPDGYFGAGSAPIVSGDRVLVNVGARGAGLVAVNRVSGKTIWKRSDEGGSYSAPTAFMRQGKTAVMFVTRKNAVCIDPQDGTEHFRFPFGKTGPTVNAATPLFNDGLLFLTASYGVGGDMRRLAGGGLKKVWSNDRSLSSQYTTPVFYKDHLYGSHGREDIGGGEFRCVEAATGDVKWSQTFGVAHVIRSGNLLLTQSVDGRIGLLRANPARFEQLATAEVTTMETKAIPALANGRLYVRVNNGRSSELLCFEVGETKK